jgi:hypothetical protein
MHRLALDQPSSRFVVRGPSFVSNRAEHSRLHRCTHCRPLDGWASVQNHMGRKPKCFARRTAIDEDGFAPRQAHEGFGIGPLDLVTALVEVRQQLGQVDIPLRGRTPINMDNRHTECVKVQRKPFKADVHHPWACWQETMRRLGHST